jgi:hypothetical protein
MNDNLILPSPRIQAYVYAVSEDGQQAHIDLSGFALDLITVCKMGSPVGQSKEQFMSWISDHYDNVVSSSPTSAATH